MATVRTATTAETPDDVLMELRDVLDLAFLDEGGFDDDDWAHTVGGTHVLVEERGVIVAHAAVVERVLHVGDRAFRTGYVEGVATRPGREGLGLGSLALAEVNEIVTGRFELGALGTGRWSFYERQGWERWRGPTYVRTGSDLVRTSEDDDGVMVLRFGPSAGIDLRAAIACDAREGDDW